MLKQVTVCLLVLGWGFNSTLAETVPSDPDRFLTFFNSVSAAHAESVETAAAYYAAIDPDGSKTNFIDWLVVNDFAASVDANALYVNDLDLGFGRDMNIKVNGDGRVVSFVRNHADDTPNVDPVDGPVEEKVHNTYNGFNLIATVAMEYTAPPSDPTGEKYTTFYAFGPDGERLLQADLDGRGAKSLPGACNSCHGGAPRPLLSDGTYPDFGDTGAGFLPWDLEALAFSSELFNGIPAFTRAAQESEFRILNASVLQTNPSDVVRDLIEGWYGGSGLPSATFNENFVPAGWLARSSTYLNAFAPNCRACHLQRNPAVDFSDSTKLDNLLSRANTLVFDHGVMPIAKRTYDRFWTDYSSVNADYTDLFGAIPLTRRPSMVPPLAFAGLDRPAVVGQVLQLDGSQTLNATAYSWLLLAAPAGSLATLSNATIVNPTFTPDLPGQYQFQLTATNVHGSTATLFNSLATSGVLTHFFAKTSVDFNSAVVDLIDSNCISCHTSPLNGGVAPPFDEPVRSTRDEAIYRNLSLRSSVWEPEQSLLLLKSTAQITHVGGAVLANPSIGYNTLRDWIKQGALREIDADNDGLDDRSEPTLATNVSLADSDGDRYQDSVEVVLGSNPLDGSSQPPRPMQVNVDRGGWQGPGSGPASVPFISDSGRYVEYCTGAIPGAIGFSCLKDLLTGKTIRLGSPDISTQQEVVTTELRYLTFRSNLSSWVNDDFNAEWDIFVYDLETEVITRESTNGVGLESNDSSTDAHVTPDGRFVIFSSDATNLVAGDTNFIQDIFLKNRLNGITTRVNTSSTGVEAQFSDSFSASISDDGRYVEFNSIDSTLVPADTNGFTDVFVKDTLTGAIVRVNTDSSGGQANGQSFTSVISGNGGYVVFYSSADNLVIGDLNGTIDVFVKNLLTGDTLRASVGTLGSEGNGGSHSATVSDDGRYVAFVSAASNLVNNDNNTVGDIFVRDIIDNITVRVSLSPAGVEANGQSYSPSISKDGHTITFITEATNLIANDQDLFTEMVQAINPLSPIDSDGDGLTDAIEILLGTDINLVDTDGDGLTDLEEVFINFSYKDYEVGVDYDPNNPDTDGDGLTDGEEVAFGFDPLNASSPGVYSVTVVPLVAYLGLGFFLTLSAWRKFTMRN